MAAVPSLAGIVANHFAAGVVVVAHNFAAAVVIVGPSLAGTAVVVPRPVAVGVVASHFVGLEKVVGPNSAAVGVIVAWRQPRPVQVRHELCDRCECDARYRELPG